MDRGHCPGKLTVVPYIYHFPASRFYDTTSCLISVLEWSGKAKDISFREESGDEDGGEFNFGEKKSFLSLPELEAF